MKSENDVFAMLEEIESIIEDGELPESAIEFAESVQEKVKAICTSVEETGYCTERQLSAVQNMLSGLQKWVRHT